MNRWLTIGEQTFLGLFAIWWLVASLCIMHGVERTVADGVGVVTMLSVALGVLVAFPE